MLQRSSEEGEHYSKALLPFVKKQAASESAAEGQESLLLFRHRAENERIKKRMLLSLLLPQLGALVLLANLYTRSDITGNLMFQYGAACAALTACTLFLTGRLYRLLCLQRKKLEQLCATEAVSAVGPLTELLSQGGNAHSLASSALLRILPKLTSLNSGVVNAEERERLYDMLRNGGPEDLELQKAILLALEKIGDRHAVTVVERLAEEANRVSRKRRELREMARLSLPAIRASAAHLEKTSLLLRASGPLLPSRQLLRPAAHRSAPQEALLRPSAEKDEAD